MRSRSAVFALLATLVAYLVWSVFWPFATWQVRGSGLLLIALIFAVVAWVPLVYWKSSSEETSRRQRFLLGMAYGGLGWLSFLLILTLARDLAAWISPFPLRTPEGSAAVLGASGLLFGIGLLGAQFGVRIKRVTIPLKNFPRELAGLKIIQITDLHVGPTIRREFVKQVVHLANQAEADLIVVTGDVADGMVSDLRDEIAPLSELRAKLGKFYVPGNHEYYWEGAAWIDRMKSLGFTALLNSHQIVESSGRRFAIAGISDPAAVAARCEGPDLVKAARGIPCDAFPKILLCHQPQFAESTAKEGFDLQISGHTHGGQFFPWTWIAARVHRHNHGLHRLGNLSIYVSRGTGYWGPPVRLGAPPEVTLIVLQPID